MSYQIHNTLPDIMTIQETKLTQKSKTPKYLFTAPYAQTENTIREWDSSWATEHSET